MEWLSMTAVLSIPMLLAIVIVAFGMRGLTRFAGMLPLLVLVIAFALDAYSASKKGNLTGLFTMIVALPALALLLIISAIGAIATYPRRRASETKPVSGPEDGSDSELA